MEIIRVRTSRILKYIEPHLTFTSPGNKLLFLEQFLKAMEFSPESIMVLAAIDDSEIVKAFLIAENPGFKSQHISIAQTWSHPDNPWSVAEEIFARVVMWALALGKTCIRGETQRNTEPIYRRFGMQPIAQVMQLDLDMIQPNLVKCIKEVL